MESLCVVCGKPLDRTKSYESIYFSEGSLKACEKCAKSYEKYVEAKEKELRSFNHFLEWAQHMKVTRKGEE